VCADCEKLLHNWGEEGAPDLRKVEVAQEASSRIDAGSDEGPKDKSRSWSGENEKMGREGEVP